MNTNDIIEKINKEHQAFLKPFNEESVFKKETKNPFSMKRNSDAEALTFCSYFLLSFGLSLLLFLQSYTIFPDFKMTIIFAVSLLLSFSTLYFVYMSGHRFFINRLYKNKHKNNIISKYFSSRFLVQTISDDVHNIIKLSLSDQDYCSLRNGEANITYEQAYSFFIKMKADEKAIIDKKQVFLTAEEIKQYNHVVL